MRNSVILALALVILSCAATSKAVTPRQARIFAGQDLHLSGDELTFSTTNSGRHILLYKGDFSLTVGTNKYSGDNAVIWITTLDDSLTQASPIYRVKVFIDGNVSVSKGKNSKTLDRGKSIVAGSGSLMTSLTISGEVFATAQSRKDVKDINDPLYDKAKGYLKPMELAKAGKPRPGAVVPPIAPLPETKESPVSKEDEDEPFFAWVMPPSLMNEPAPSPQEPQDNENKSYQYPVNISGIWEPAPEIEKSTLADGTNVATVIGRFYLWHRLDEKGDMIEFQADEAVVFLADDKFKVSDDKNAADKLLASGKVKSIYIRGNIVMTEGDRTINADEIFYNFVDSQALIVNAQMRSFDQDRDIPIYLRANKLLRVSESIFEAKDIVLTNDEFYMPQISATASSIVVTDTSNLENRATKLDNAKYQAVMEDMRLKLGETTIFRWPKLVSSSENPHLPIKSLSIGNGSSFGTSVETDWYLNRLMGWKEKPGVDSTLSLDYYSKRGLGVGVDTKYQTDTGYGEMIGYMIDDNGEDKLGRSRDRNDIEPDNNLRGRATIRHREYLPYDWQMTLELGYLSDKNFQESFYRDEFNTEKEPETLIHLKRLKNNWAFSWLAKVRINDFQDELEELPTAQFHMVGQDLFGGLFTYYTHNKFGRFRQRHGDDSTLTGSQESFTFGSSRHEIDMPLTWGNAKFVPYVAGTFAFDDGDGFSTGLNGKVVDSESSVWLGELGMRTSTQFWKVDPTIHSRLWDLNGIKHTLKPHMEFSVYQESDDSIDSRNTINIGLSQRWQTKRGDIDNLRTVDWMRFNVDTTFVADSADISDVGPDKYVFNDPTIPMFKRRETDQYGIRRNSINADYYWSISDTYAVMSDMNYDIEAGTVDQVNVGITRYCWPNLSWYIGNRYLKRIVSTSSTGEYYEEGSDSVTFGITYKLSSRYTVLFNQEYNFDYGKNVQSELAIVRHYHRIYYGFTISADESLDSSSIVFSIWPEGVKDLAIGSRKYYGLSRANYYNN